MRGLLPVIGAVFFACATAPVRVPFDVSAPTVIPDGVLGRIDADGSTTLYMDGWDLKIAVQNQRSYVRGSGWDLSVVLFPLPMIIPTIAPEVNPPADRDSSPLVVFLHFHSRADGLVFYPDSVRLLPNDGQAASMNAFIGPADLPCNADWESPEASREFVLPPGEPSCFVLQFPTLGSPETGFQLHLSGIATSDEPVPPIDLRFAKFTGSTDD